MRSAKRLFIRAARCSASISFVPAAFSMARAMSRPDA
ncbi:hypothetical protein COSO111634_37520 [Corallococcus soli]